MAVVTYTPDQAAGRGRSGHRTALVLGAGGVLGAAWMTGALACLQEWLQHALNDADLIVGTSAGSVLAAALRCGATVEEMAAWQRGDAAGITFSDSATGHLVNVTVGTSGKFSLGLVAGTYTATGKTKHNESPCSAPVTVTVRAGQLTRVSLVCKAS